MGRPAHLRPWRALRTRRAALLAAGLAVVAAAGLTWWWTGRDGPLGPASSQLTAEICFPAAGRLAATLGSDVLENRSGGDVELTGVRLVGADGVHQRSAALLPLSTDFRDVPLTSLAGSRAGHPPANGMVAAGLWDRHREADGARLAAGEVVNLVVLVDLDRPGGVSVRRIEVDYRAGWRTYRWRSGTATEITAAANC